LAVLHPREGVYGGAKFGTPLITFERKRAIRFKFGTDIQDAASLHRDHKTTPKWAWPGNVT